MTAISKSEDGAITIAMWLGIAFVLGSLFLAPGTALSDTVTSAPPGLFFDPSVRAAGMGTASTAVFWGDDPNYWTNPALLGYHKGIRYEWSRTQLLPGMTDDVYFTTDRLTLGACGVALSLAGEPWDGLGGLKLDYGKIEGTDPFGNPTGTFSSYEEIRSWGIGLSIAQLTENALGLVGWKLPPISRFGDVSLGTSRNELKALYAPAWATPSGVAFEGDATTHNRGFLVRLTPYNSIEFPGLLPTVDSFLRPTLGGVRVDFAYGTSVHNYQDSEVAWPSGSRSGIAKNEKRGLAVRLALGFPGVLEEHLKTEGVGWLAKVFTPLISWGKAWDRTRASRRDPETDERQTEGEVKPSGWELTLANIFAIRKGRIDDPPDIWYGVHGTTSGWGMGLQAANLGGFRYDKATVPQSTALEEKIHRKAFSIWINPPALWQIIRHRGGP